MKRRKLKLLLSLAVVLILLGVIKLVSNQFNQPSTAAVNIGKTKPTSLSYSIDLTPKLYSAKYAQFDYPSGLVLQKTSTVQPPTLDQINFLGHDVITWLLNISVSSLPNGDLNNDSSFAFRQNNPSVYTRATQSINGKNVIVMTDKSASDFNEVAFLTNGNQVATVALSGNDIAGTEPLIKSLNMVISSWTWR